MASQRYVDLGSSFAVSNFSLLCFRLEGDEESYFYGQRANWFSVYQAEERHGVGESHQWSGCSSKTPRR